MKRARAGPAKQGSRSLPASAAERERSLKDEVRVVLAWLERQGTSRTRDGTAPFVVTSDLGEMGGERRAQAARQSRVGPAARGAKSRRGSIKGVIRFIPMQ